MRTYQSIIDQFPQQMLAGEGDRLSLIKQVLDALGNPERTFQIIHVAGTNGKGSTGALLARFLMASGQRVGHFNSPTLVNEREQILVDGQMIGEDTFVATFQKIEAALPSPLTIKSLTVFEWWTVVMLQYFADQNVDWAVIECGLGGTDDATNVIGAPKIAVITHLALDHTRILGPTIEDIAMAKAGIIKAGTRAVVVAPNQPEKGRAVLIQRAKEAGVTLVEATQLVKVTLKGDVAHLKSGEESAFTPCKLRGRFQEENLTTALAVVIKLREQGLTVTLEAIERVLREAVLPGRMQVIDHAPLVIIDGAHNPDAASQVAMTIKEEFAKKRVTMVLGFLADKDVKKMVATYQQVADHLVFTNPNHPTRAFDSRPLALAMGDEWAPTGPEAVEIARKLTPREGVIIVTGSFYLIKELEELTDANLDRKP
ncbi:MAG: folylpolyglutamate synthase/dihydrofolate synthase family protein [Limosilactobacillus gorillae]|uniref:bifunctional folylpolyglutamate synthase/dihydrofolate synthase n=1 Tax=Limosilactobacillus gorillae TaxID=1450649 RepID=UPI000A9A48BD|nr:folylpolyglutamate synthase/dihydrofolate synthase family protein [Limosilactobacillus gorillae]MDO4855679.1 folylpolyglutamate synthase/dihydrofolate synthase family protein [Limosilactobacillus gorillae]